MDTHSKKSMQILHIKKMYLSNWQLPKIKGARKTNTKKQNMINADQWPMILITFNKTYL